MVKKSETREKNMGFYKMLIFACSSRNLSNLSKIRSMKSATFKQVIRP